MQWILHMLQFKYKNTLVREQIQHAGNEVLGSL